MPDKQLKMSFQPTVIEHLGVKMYSHTVPAIAELVANAYDAGATVGTLSIGADVFALGGLIEVRHEAAVKLEVTHALLMYEPHSSRSAVCRVVAGV